MYDEDEEGGSRYVISAIDEHTWTLLAPETMRLYLLTVSRLESKFNALVSLIELGDTDRRYFEFRKEILSIPIYATSPKLIRGVVQQIITMLEDGEDIDNPVELAGYYAAELLNERIQWPPVPANKCH